MCKDPSLLHLSSTMWNERSPAKESMGDVMSYVYHLIGVAASLCVLDLFLGISSEICFGGCLSLRVEFFRALDLVLVVGLSIYCVGYVSGYFLRERKSALLDMLGTYAYKILIFGTAADGVKNTERWRIEPFAPIGFTMQTVADAVKSTERCLSVHVDTRGRIRFSYSGNMGDTAASASSMRIITGNDDCPVSGGESICEPSVRKSSIWIMDTAAQCHATGDLRLFSDSLNLTNTGSWVYGVSGREHSLPIRGFGTVQFADFTLQHVFYVEGLPRNLICLSKLQETFGYIIKFGKAAYIEDEATGRRICELRKVQGLYELYSVSVALERTPAAD